MSRLGPVLSSAGRKPGTPTIGTASAGDSQATVTFTAPAYLGKPSSSLMYTVVSSPNSISNTGSGSPITVTGLSNGTSYTFRVKLNNTIIDSDFSEPSNQITPVYYNPFGFIPFGFIPPPPPPVPFSFTPYEGGYQFGPPLPWSNSIDVNTKIRTLDGLKPAGEIKVGDILLGLNIPSDLDDAEWTSWISNPDNFTANVAETTVTSTLQNSSSEYVYIDGDLFTPTHYILTKKDNVIKYTKVDLIDNTYQRYSFEENDFVDIEIVEDINVEKSNISIHCEPHDNFFTEQMLVMESLPH